MSKITNIVLKALQKRNDCPTAEKLYMELKNEYPEISLRTIGTELSNMCEQGKIIKVKSRAGGADKYDANNLPHIYLECEKCGEVYNIFLYDIQIKRFDNEIRKLAKEKEGETITSTIAITVICKNCKK